MEDPNKQSGSSPGRRIEPGPARRPITNMPDEPLNEEPAREHSGLNPITPVLPEPDRVLEGLKEEARLENDKMLSEGTDGDRHKLIQRTVIDEITRAQTWAKVRCPAQTKDKIVLEIVKAMEAGQTFNYAELQKRIKSDVDKAYRSSRAHQMQPIVDKPYFSGRPRQAPPDDRDDIDMAGPWNMLPRWKRHGGSDGGTYGIDPDIVQNALDEYEQQGMPSSKMPVLEKAHDNNNTRGDLPLETTGLESLDWIDEKHIVQLKCPSPLGPANHRILKRAIQIIEQRTFKAEEAGKRADQLKKPLGTQGLQQALALELKIPVRDIENCWRSVRRYPWNKIFIRVERD